MGEILSFKTPKAAEKYRGHTLCRHGFHKWELVKQRTFDVKLGRLVTRYQCMRCGAIRTQAR
jgi:hypothetical protein